MEIIAIANQKGGIGKTTTAIGVAGALQLQGNKVLMVDMDEQCNVTDTYQAKIGDGIASIFDVLVEGDFEGCVQQTPAGDIIPGDPMMKDASKYLDTLSGIHKLKKALNVLGKEYDYVIIDTPPSLNVCLTNALTAATSVIIPISSDRYGIKGLVNLYQTIQDVKEYANPDLKVRGLLVVKHKSNTQLTKAMEESLPEFEKLFHTKVFQTKIRESMEIRKSQAMRKTFFETATYESGAIDYRILGYELTGIYEAYRQRIESRTLYELMGTKSFVDYMENGRFEELFGDATYDVISRIEVQKLLEKEKFYRILEDPEQKTNVVRQIINGEDLDDIKQMMKGIR